MWWLLLVFLHLTDIFRKVYRVYRINISCSLEVWRIFGSQQYISLKISYSCIRYGFLGRQSSVKSSEYVICFSTFSVSFEILSSNLPFFLSLFWYSALAQIGIPLIFRLNFGISKKEVLDFCTLYIFDSYISNFDSC